MSNTTTARPPTLRDQALAREAGGLSGAPLFRPSTRLLAEASLRLAGRLPLVGVGGVNSGEAALKKIRAGASLVQLYTGLVYRGPALIGEIKARLLGELQATGAGSLADLVGRDAAAMARGEF